MAAKWALEATWRALGGLLEPLNKLGRPRGGFQGRMGRSWTPLGELLEAFGAPKTLSGSALGRPKSTKETGFELSEGPAIFFVEFVCISGIGGFGGFQKSWVVQATFGTLVD